MPKNPPATVLGWVTGGGPEGPDAALARTELEYEQALRRVLMARADLREAGQRLLEIAEVYEKARYQELAQMHGGLSID